VAALVGAEVVAFDAAAQRRPAPAAALQSARLAVASSSATPKSPHRAIAPSGPSSMSAMLAPTRVAESSPRPLRSRRSTTPAVPFSSVVGATGGA
jgi:hypothetical protein